MSTIHQSTQKSHSLWLLSLSGAALFFAAGFLLAKFVEPLSQEPALIAQDNSGYVVHETP